MEKKNPYEDIIHLPHHQAANRTHMSLYDRAAQFSPYAALVGYDDMVKETARQTEKQLELGDTEKELLDQKLALIADVIEDPFIKYRISMVTRVITAAATWLSVTEEINRPIDSRQAPSRKKANSAP